MENKSAAPGETDDNALTALPAESTTAVSTTTAAEITDANFAPVMYFALRDDVSCFPGSSASTELQQNQLLSFALPEDILLLICCHFSTITRLRLLSLVSRAFYNAVTNSFTELLDVTNLRNRWCRLLALRLPHVPRNVTVYNNLKCMQVRRNTRKVEPSLQFLAVLARKSMGGEKAIEKCSYEADEANSLEVVKVTKAVKKAKAREARERAQALEAAQQSAIGEAIPAEDGVLGAEVEEDAKKKMNQQHENGTIAKILGEDLNPNLRYRTIESLSINAAIDMGFEQYVTRSLTSLTSLTLFNTKLSQSRFAGMSSLTNLTCFKLVSSAKITTFAPTLVQLTQLRELSLYNTLIDNANVERCMGELPLLDTLALSVNHRINGPTLAFSNVRNLTFQFPLHFGHDKRLYNLANFHTLITLELNQLAETNFLPELTNLASLKLFNCSVTTLPWNLPFLETYIVKRPENYSANLLEGKLMPRLRFLDVERARVNGEKWHTCLSMYENLTSLGLNRHLSMTSDCLWNLPAAKCITELYLNYCESLTDISFLLQFPNLSTLQLRSCVKLTSLEPLQHMTQLTYLVLSSVARVSIEWPWLTGLKRLQYLDVRLPKRGKTIVFTPENPNAKIEGEEVNNDDDTENTENETTASSSTKLNTNESERVTTDSSDQNEQLPTEYNFYFPPENDLGGLSWVGVLKKMLPNAVINCGATAATTSDDC